MKADIMFTYHLISSEQCNHTNAFIVTLLIKMYSVHYGGMQVLKLTLHLTDLF